MYRVGGEVWSTGGEGGPHSRPGERWEQEGWIFTAWAICFADYVPGFGESSKETILSQRYLPKVGLYTWRTAYFLNAFLELLYPCANALFSKRNFKTYNWWKHNNKARGSRWIYMSVLWIWTITVVVIVIAHSLMWITGNTCSIKRKQIVLTYNFC